MVRTWSVGCECSNRNKEKSDKLCKNIAHTFSIVTKSVTSVGIGLKNENKPLDADFEKKFIYLNWAFPLPAWGGGGGLPAFLVP